CVCREQERSGRGMGNPGYARRTSRDEELEDSENERKNRRRRRASVRDANSVDAESGMKPLLQSFLREQGYALLEPKPDGHFVLLGEPPAWFTEIWGRPSAGGALNLAEPSPFLENFLEDARAFWKAGRGEVCASGTWIEQTRERKDIPLEAVALRVDGEPLLSIHSPQRLFAEQSQV